MPAPIEAEPAHVALDGVDIFLLFLDRIGIVETQMAAAAEFLGDAEIQADRFGVADMEIAVRLRRKPSDDGLVPARGDIRANDVADEVLARFSTTGSATVMTSTLPYWVFRTFTNAGLNKLPVQVKSAYEWRNCLTSFHFQLCYTGICPRRNSNRPRQKRR